MESSKHTYIQEFHDFLFLFNLKSRLEELIFAELTSYLHRIIFVTVQKSTI